MAPKIPDEALESARDKLTSFKSRLPRLEVKAFEIVSASKESMKKCAAPHTMESQLVAIMETKTRLPCIVCQGEQGVIYCTISYISKLSQKERISHTKLVPPFYCVFYPNENVFYTTRSMVPEVIGDSLVQVFGGTRIKKLLLVGKDFRSLRQLHFHKAHNGLLRRRPVKDADLPLDYNMADEAEAEKDDVIEDEDEPWKRKKQEYYQKHFYPECDPTITKFTVSSASSFCGKRNSRHLSCDLKVTFRTDNLISFFDYSMDKGVLTYPLSPFFENVLNIGRTSITLDPTE